MLSLKDILKGDKVSLPPKWAIKSTLSKRQKSCHYQPQPHVLEGSSTLLERSYNG